MAAHAHKWREIKAKDGTYHTVCIDCSSRTSGTTSSSSSSSSRKPSVHLTYTTHRDTDVYGHVTKATITYRRPDNGQEVTYNLPKEGEYDERALRRKAEQQLGVTSDTTAREDQIARARAASDALRKGKARWIGTTEGDNYTFMKDGRKIVIRAKSLRDARKQADSA